MVAGTERERDAPRRFGPWRREARSFLELFALTGIAVVQPTLDTLRRNSKDVFVAAGATQLQIIALVAIILVAPPAILWLVEVAVGLVVPPLRRWAHAALAGSVVALIAFEILSRQSGFGDPAKYGSAVLIGVAAAILLLRVEAARLFLWYLSIAPIVFTVMFLLSDQMSPLVAFGDTGNADVAIARPSRVVMLVMDEFPTASLLDGTGHVDAGLFPNFAAIAADSTWYRNATSVSPLTTSAVPALLTGNYPTDPRAPQTASVFPGNLFTLLGGSYQINAHENLEALNPSGDAGGPDGLEKLLRRSIDLWERSVTDAPWQSEVPTETANEQAPALRRFVASLGAASSRQLDYAHVLLPHSPWRFLPDGRTYTNDTQLPGFAGGWSGTWGGGQELATVARQRHILQLQFTDRLLGRVISKLKRLGVYDKSLLVLVADHGEGFTGLSPQRVATPENYTEIMWIPLFIKAPGQEAGAIDDRPASAVDVLPTIAETLGTNLPWKTDGRSLLGPARPNGPRRFLKTTVYASNAPAESKYQEWDGVRGFSTVLASRAAQPGGDTSLRVYKGESEFGELVGQPAAPFLDTAAPTISGSVTQPWLYANVNPGARSVPWTYLQARLDFKGGRDIAIAVNGTIASISRTYTDRIFGGAGLVALLPPSVFERGNNDVQMYAVTGTPDTPRLQPVKPPT